MIVRVWHGRTPRAAAQAYEDFVRTEVFPEMRAIDGCLGAELCRRDHGDEIAYLAITRFESLEAVRRFAGDDYERAVVESEARRLLTGFDERSAHYEVVRA